MTEARLFPLPAGMVFSGGREEGSGMQACRKGKFMPFRA
jgi:hypothetical protein